MVSSHSFTELQLLRSGMALSIRGGLSKLFGGWGGGISWRESEDEKRLRSEEEAQRASERARRGRFVMHESPGQKIDISGEVPNRVLYTGRTSAWTS